MERLGLSSSGKPKRERKRLIWEDQDGEAHQSREPRAQPLRMNDEPESRPPWKQTPGRHAASSSPARDGTQPPRGMDPRSCRPAVVEG